MVGSKVTTYARRIQNVYDRFGGTRKSAKVCGYSAELLSNWKRKGRVPLKKVAEICNVLNCHPLELNFKEIQSLLVAIKEAEVKGY